MQRRIVDLAIIAGFVAITIAHATTTSSSRFVYETIRLVCVLVLAVSVLFLVQRQNGFTRHFLLSAAFLAIFLTYGVVRALATGSLGIVEAGIGRDVLLIFCLAYLFSQGYRAPVSDFVGLAIIVYGVCVLVVTMLSGGFTFSYPPRFVFEYEEAVRNAQIGYSQGVSKFFGYVAVVAGYFAVRSLERVRILLFSLLTVLFLLLSALGGARGDSLAAIFIVISYGLFFGSAHGRSLLLLLCGLVGAWLWFSVDVGDFALLRRLSALDGGLGTRDVLYSMAIELIGVEPVCSYFGCGFAYFQHYYGLNPGSYPHNFFLELGVVFGVPLSIFLLVMWCLGFVKVISLQESESALYFLIFFYSFLLQLKSGTLLGAWWLMAAMFTTAGFVLIRGQSRTV